MALWLFRRKSRRKRSRGNLSDGEGGDRGREAQQAPPGRRQTEPGGQQATRNDSQQSKKQRIEPTKLQRRTRTYSFSPGRNDRIRVDSGRSPTRKHQSVPQPPRNTGGMASATRMGRIDDDPEKVDSGVSALGDDLFPRAPTLHNKRGGNNQVPRKKSSKRRRRSDQAREAEIRAMSPFAPVRPATDDNTAGRPMKKESRRVRTGFSIPFGKPEWDKENLSSDVSLPIPESLHSSLSSDSEHVAYKVSAFEALAPRPTLRYDHHPRSGASLPANTASQRRKLSERSPYPEATIRAHKRIDDLANDLSASDLRELMERDKRRRDRKAQKDQEKLERRLARRAEKQRSDEALAKDIGIEPPKNLERGVMGRELVGLGIDNTSAVVTSSRRRPSDSSSKRRSKSLSEKDESDLKEMEARPHPLDSFRRMSSIATETPLSPVEAKESVPPLPQRGSRGFLKSRKSRTGSMTVPPEGREGQDSSEKPRKGSVGGSSRGTSSWTSIFRWGSKSKKQPGPSSFSNTSRDSMPPQPPQPTLPATFVPPRKPSTGVPKRTKSRFREDLPELPQYSPEEKSRWSETDPVPPTITEQSPDPDQGEHADDMHVASSPTAGNMMRYDTPTSLDRSVEGMRQTPTSWTRREELQPSPAPHSLSLASIDSEASWLSGRITGRRRSGGVSDNLPRIEDNRTGEKGGSNGTIGSSEHDHDEDMHGDDHSVADDEYLSRFARPSGSEQPRWKRKSTGEARPSSDEDEDPRWGSVKEKQPTMIHGHSAGQKKSREGLLNSFGDADEDSDIDELHSPDKEENAALERATSINLGKGHVRHISAGSARLLDLTPRSSVDAKRRSVGA